MGLQQRPFSLNSVEISRGLIASTIQMGSSIAIFHSCNEPYPVTTILRTTNAFLSISKTSAQSRGQVYKYGEYLCVPTLMPRKAVLRFVSQDLSSQINYAPNHCFKITHQYCASQLCVWCRVFIALPRFLGFLSAIQILRVNFMVLPIFAYVLQLFVPTEWFAHIKCVLAFFPTSRVVAVVIDHSSENTIAIARVLNKRA